MKKNMGKIILAGLAVLCLLGIIRQEWIEKESNRPFQDEQTQRIALDDNGREIKIKKIEEDTEDYDVSKAFYKDYDDEGLQTYTITLFFCDAEYYVSDARKEGLCTYVYKNDDGAIDVQMTEEQRQSWLAIIDKNIDEVLNNENDLIKVELSEDDSQLTAHVNGDISAVEMVSDLSVVVYNGELRQIFNGKADWAMRMTVINMENEHVLTDIDVRKEDFEITGDMFDE